MEHKTIQVDGVEVLLIKWQDEDQDPSIRCMAYVDGIFAETEFGFKNSDGRDKAWEEKMTAACSDFVSLAKAASDPA